MKSTAVVLMDDAGDYILEHLVEFGEFFNDTINDLSCPIVDLFF